MGRRMVRLLLVSIGIAVKVYLEIGDVNLESAQGIFGVRYC